MVLKTTDDLSEFKRRYSIQPHHFWFHKPSKHWIVSHDGVMKAADQEEIWFTAEVINDGPERKALMVTAHREGHKPVMMTGECVVGEKGISKEYPWAMAQKRGEDRAVLRMLAPGGGLYSEVEASDFDRRSNSTVDYRQDEPSESDMVRQDLT